MDKRESKEHAAETALVGERPVAVAIQLAREFGEATGLPTDVRSRLCIVVEELAANLRDHGAIGPKPPRLALTWRRDAIRICLIDFGPPFDPRKFKSMPSQSDRGGGAGLALVRRWAEVLDYSSDASGNRLELRMILDGAGSGDERSTPDQEQELDT